MTNAAKLVASPRGRPPRAQAGQRRQQRRDEIMQHAAEIFAAAGIRAVTMDQLAERLGIAKVILYRFFSSREELIGSILEHTTAQLEALNTGPWKGLDHSIDRTLEVARGNSAGCRLVLKHCASDASYRSYYDRIHSGVIAAVEHRLGDEYPALREDPMRLALSAHAVAGFMVDVTLHWLESGEPRRDGEFRDWLRHSLAALYLHWLDRRP